MLRLLLVLAAATAWSQPLPERLREAGDIEWKVSGSLPPGAEYHLLYEHPETSAVQTLVRFPKGYVLKDHSHSHDETILVLKGKLEVEVGARARTLRRGSYAVIPAGTVHTLRAKGWGRCELMVAMSGPFDIKGLP